MKLAMAQMRMTGSMDENLKTSLEMCDSARGCDLLFFPEVQLTPFFPQYEKRDVSGYILKPDSEPIRLLCNAAKKNGLYMSPNVYLEADGKRYDTSLWIDPCGELKGTAKMVHIAQAEQSIVVHPSGDVIVKADNKQRLVTCDIDLAEVELWRGKRPYISTRRKDMYL